MYEQVKKMLEGAQHIVVIQAENPDGDSLGSSLALEELIGDMGMRVSLFCSVDMPKYLRHLKGWDRVTNDFPHKADVAIIVDTLSDTLLSRTLEAPSIRHFLETHPVLVLDHHGEVEDNLPFPHETIISPTAVATGELIADIAIELEWSMNPAAASAIYISIMADSLGLTTPSTTAHSFRTVATLIDRGAIPADIENARRKLMKKSAEILEYKGKLLQRVEYYLDGVLAVVHIPWDEIEKYSDQYNPSVLVLDEMRMVEGVGIAVALKTYPDGRVTGKLRANSEAKVAETVAAYFGGGGHPYAAGFRVYEDIASVKRELLDATDKALREYNETITAIEPC